MRSEIGPQWNCHTLHFVTGHRLYMLFSHLKNVSKCSLKRSKRQLLLICCLSLKLYLNCKTQHFESLIFHGRVKKHITFHSIGLQQSVLVCMKLIKLAYLVALWERLCTHIVLNYLLRIRQQLIFLEQFHQKLSYIFDLANLVCEVLTATQLLLLLLIG